MGKRKIECNNKSCKHHVYDGKCDTCIVLDEAGKCQSFEKGFAYYFHIVWNALGNKNFIDAIEVKQKPDLKIGMYYCFRPLSGNCISQYHPCNPATSLGSWAGLRGKNIF